MWGTGASSTQCEGAAPASDWWGWERAGHAPLSGDGNGFSARFAEDFGLLAGIGLTHHRLSLEWARLEPEQGVVDRGAVEHYRSVLSAARAAGLSPWVCLHHFTLPKWFADSGGFLVERNRTEVWARHVDFVAETFGDLVAGWQPVNETNYYARAAYGGRGWPPGHNDRDEVAHADEAIQLASAEAALGLRGTGKPVSSIFGLSPIVAQDDEPTTSGLAQTLYDAFWAPGLELFRDGVLRVPGRKPVGRADLAGCVRPDRLLLLRRYGCTKGPVGRTSTGCGGLAPRVRHLARWPRSGPRPAPCRAAVHPPAARRVWHRNRRRRRPCRLSGARPLRRAAPRLAGVSQCEGSSIGRPWTTTSGSTATESPSGSSIAIATSGPALGCSNARRSRERRVAAGTLCRPEATRPGECSGSAVPLSHDWNLGPLGSQGRVQPRRRGAQRKSAPLDPGRGLGRTVPGNFPHRPGRQRGRLDVRGRTRAGALSRGRCLASLGVARRMRRPPGGRVPRRGATSAPIPPSTER